MNVIHSGSSWPLAFGRPPQDPDLDPDPVIAAYETWLPRYRLTAAPLRPAETQLSIFKPVSIAYEPSSWWLDGHCPAHPHFENAGRIQFWVKTIKQPLLRYIIEGCELLLERAGNKALTRSIAQNNALWRAAVSIHKYGVIYLATRSDCREEFLRIVKSNPKLFDEIDVFLSADQNATRAINYGVHRLVNSGTLTVSHETYLVPPRAISSIGINHVVVRASDFEGDSICLLDEPSAVWDLHDFAHLTAASLSPELFGSKYFSHLTKLPRKLTALIRSPKMKTANPSPRCSDGVIFSELLTPLFAAEVEAARRGSKAHTYLSLTEILANKLADYLMGRCKLQHLSSGKMLSMEDEPITAVQLAVLLQNKSYELTASEIEQRVLTRGGPVGDTNDDLDNLTGAKRIEALARCRRWRYFEVRNTIKHRAHKLAYKKVAERMMADCTQSVSDKALLECILDVIDYASWEKDGVCNLWQVVTDEEVSGRCP
ncbi:hypothetical protein MGYG_03366 [Nannizzia gypsea CBS 118893]|uniref:Uncharacterized protein n=1 Tax=Arthroderma gypseum (strain ATCC MYA-4604 / CBS 118893) TaxID=535722 RepID=E4UN62_ARTGP|nr:hypothetical protein MGYG_03366 [Nannizzia gypsea CBS 118893]EFR00364.1 hypothetical protein MGYG_03366 [Nannizzia gypsea CBS 118893]